MATSDDPWRDDLTSQTDMDGCMACGKPTNSHLLLFVWDGDNEVFQAVEDHDDADAYGHVCHGCYADHNGDHAPILQQYRLKVERLTDKYNLSVEMLVMNPSEVQEIMDSNDWDKL